jgi:Mu-like prophage major head subunit gpT
MAGIISTGSLPKLLWPGIKAIHGNTYNQHPRTYPSLFTTVPSDKAWEDYVVATGFTLARAKAEGQGMTFDDQAQGPTTRIVNTTYALGYIVTMEEKQDNLYQKVAERRTKSNAISMAQAKEVNMHLFYNRAFTSGYVGGDGVVLGSTAHTLQAGGTYANTPVAGAMLNEASLEDALISIMGFVDDKGLLIGVKPLSLIVPRQLTYQGTRLLKSMYQPGTGNNDINALMATNAFPDGLITSVYLTSPGAWFIRTDAGGDSYGMIYQERMGLEFDQDNEFNTRNFMAGSVERYGGGWDDARGLWCNPSP